jgi:hypothetical protein
MSGFISALLQLLGGSRDQRQQKDPLADFDSRGAMVSLIGEEDTAHLERELAYRDQVARMERIIELRRREVAARAQLESLR